MELFTLFSFFLSSVQEHLISTPILVFNLETFSEKTLKSISAFIKKRLWWGRGALWHNSSQIWWKIHSLGLIMQNCIFGERYLPKRFSHL